MALKVLTKDSGPGRGWPTRKNYLKSSGVYTHNTVQWISGAIKHPGALHKSLGVPMGKTIPAGKLSAAAKKGGTLGRRARLAQTLKRMH